MSNKILDNETVNRYQKIISKSVWNYIRETNNHNLDVEGLIQDLWVVILEYNDKNGHLPDYALAKTICHNALVNITRKVISHGGNPFLVDFNQERGTQIADLIGLQNAEDGAVDWADTSAMDNAISSTEIDELLNMFPEGSKERKYIEFYLSKAGIKDIVRPEDKGREGGYTDSALAKSLGFHGTGDRAWKRFNAQMKSIIADYYGYKQ